MILHNWVGSKPNGVLAGEHVGEVDKSSYLGSCISPCGHVSDKVSPGIGKG